MSSYTLTAKEQMVLVQKTYPRIQEGYVGCAYYWVGNYCVPISLLPGSIKCTGKYKHENDIIYAEVIGKGVIGRDDIRDVTNWLDISYIFKNNPDGVWTWISDADSKKEKEILERISSDLYNLLTDYKHLCNYSTEIDTHYRKNWFTAIYPKLGDFTIVTRRSNCPPQIMNRVMYNTYNKPTPIPGTGDFTLPFLWEKTDEEIDFLCTEIISNLSQRIEFLLENNN